MSPPARPPTAPPPFSRSDIKSKIPQHLFNRSLFWSTFHVLVNLALITALLIAVVQVSQIEALNNSLLWGVFIWPLYWYCQGTLMMGTFVLGHEGGHQAFSDYPMVNHFVGWLLHSLVLTPYNAWRITHGKHHANTGSMENDEPFVPLRASQVTPISRKIRKIWPLALIQMVIIFSIGWFPLYLVGNFGGPKKYTEQKKSVNHFNPWAAFIPKDQVNGVILSDIGCGLVTAVLLGYGLGFYGPELTTIAATRWGVLLKLWLGAFIVFNFTLGLITYLQHTDEYSPHAYAPAWKSTHGAFLTIDRSYGWLYNFATNHITDSHVCHHLFSTMPFYNAKLATPYIKAAAGAYYMEDDTRVLPAFWRAYRTCGFVPDPQDTKDGWAWYQ